MANIDQSRFYLDYAGLSEYDRLIKELINQNQNSVDSDLNDILSTLETVTQTIEANKEDAESKIAANADAIAVLNGSESTEGSVAQKISKAINDLINGAPEAFDTLKEISDWISSDETGTAALISKVEANEDAIKAESASREASDNSLKAYVDSRDDKVYNSTSGISLININSLFNEKVHLAEGQSVVDAIGSLEAGHELVLNKEMSVSGDISISDNAVIDANGSTFSGTVTIAKDAEVVIKNATFANPVVIQ